MAVLITLSSAYGGAPYADAMATLAPVSPQPLGIDLGPVVNGSYGPVIDKIANTGFRRIYIRHSATFDPITSVKTFIQLYGAGTGFPYGGAISAAVDYANLKALGFGSGSSKNNADQLSGGIWIDMAAANAVSSHFDRANFPDFVKVYGSANLGTDLLSAYPMVKEAMVIDTSQGAGADSDGGYLPSAPQDMVIGKQGDGVLGDSAKIRMRIYLPGSYTNGGYHQVEYVISYSFTA